MRANVGDQLRVRGRRIGRAERWGRILEVRGSGGGPPFLVRWQDTGTESVVYPGSDATVEHHQEPASS